MCKVIAIANQKGGVGYGKTTTCVNLGIGLAREGKKVLLVEADAQGSLSVSLGIQEPDELEMTLVQILGKVINEEEIDLEEGIRHHEEGVDFIPANIELAGLETSLVNVMSREQILRLYLEEIKVPTAHTTHQWISDMLEDMTIDTRSESMGYALAANSNSSLQMQKAGMKLMTPGQISRMPKDDCILFLEGYRPIYDKKNWPFHTKEFQQAERAAGKQGYTNPVRAIYNEKTGQYKTLEGEEKLRILSEEEFAFFKEAAKTDDSIKTFEMDMQQFLYTNWKDVPHPTDEEICNMIQNISKKDITEMEPPEDVYPLLEEEDYDGESEEEKPWDLSGSVVDCLLRYAEQLSPEEIEEIIGGMEDGLSDKEIKKYFTLHDAEKMRQYRIVLLAEKGN